MYIYIYMYIYAQTHTYTYTYTYIYIYLSIYLYIYILIYISISISIYLYIQLNKKCIPFARSCASPPRAPPPARPLWSGLQTKRKKSVNHLTSSRVYILVVSRCRGIGPPSGIPSSGLCFCWPPTTSSSKHSEISSIERSS